MSDRKEDGGRTGAMRRNAEAIAAAGGLDRALQSGALPKGLETTLSEALVLGLLRQGVRTQGWVSGTLELDGRWFPKL